MCVFVCVIVILNIINISKYNRVKQTVGFLFTFMIIILNNISNYLLYAYIINDYILLQKYY